MYRQWPSVFFKGSDPVIVRAKQNTSDSVARLVETPHARRCYVRARARVANFVVCGPSLAGNRPIARLAPSMGLGQSLAENLPNTDPEISGQPAFRYPVNQPGRPILRPASMQAISWVVLPSLAGNCCQIASHCIVQCRIVDRAGSPCSALLAFYLQSSVSHSQSCITSGRLCDRTYVIGRPRPRRPLRLLWFSVVPFRSSAGFRLIF